jgi:hypothetical protein
MEPLLFRSSPELDKAREALSPHPSKEWGVFFNDYPTHMSAYTLISPDGTRQTVQYDRCHDGPVSERLYLRRRISFLNRKLKQFLNNPRLRSKLSEAGRQLIQLDRDHPRVPSPPHRTTTNRRIGPRLEPRNAPACKRAPDTLETAPSAAVSQLATMIPAAPSAPAA